MVCYAQDCGSFAVLSAKSDEEYLQEEIRSVTIKHRLRPHFTCSSFPADMASVKFDVHPTMKALWLEAEEWHLLSTDHCDVYGFNIWAPVWLDEQTDMVFGGQDERKEWQMEQDKKQLGVSSSSVTQSSWSCASPGWYCCMAFSEFDYLLVCHAPESDQYGHVHHITSNAQKEAYCCTIDELINYLANFIEEGKARRKARENNAPFRNYRSNSSLVRPLKLLRKAIIDAVIRSGGGKDGSK